MFTEPMRENDLNTFSSKFIQYLKENKVKTIIIQANQKNKRYCFVANTQMFDYRQTTENGNKRIQYMFKTQLTQVNKIPPTTDSAPIQHVIKDLIQDLKNQQALLFQEKE